MFVELCGVALSVCTIFLSFGRSNPLVGKPRLFEKVSVNKHIEIRERQEQFLLREVLPQTFVSDLFVSEYIFHDVENILNLSLNSQLSPLNSKKAVGEFT